MPRSFEPGPTKHWRHSPGLHQDCTLSAVPARPIARLAQNFWSAFAVRRRDPKVDCKFYWYPVGTANTPIAFIKLIRMAFAQLGIVNKIRWRSSLQIEISKLLIQRANRSLFWQQAPETRRWTWKMINLILLSGLPTGLFAPVSCAKQNAKCF